MKLFLFLGKNLTSTDIGLLSHKSLFQIQAERLLKIRHLAASLHARGAPAAISPFFLLSLSLLRPDVESVRLPLYVMTSDGTHATTVAYFERHAFFGLRPDDVFFFQQGRIFFLNAIVFFSYIWRTCCFPILLCFLSSVFFAFFCLHVAPTAPRGYVSLWYSLTRPTSRHRHAAGARFRRQDYAGKRASPQLGGQRQRRPVRGAGHLGRLERHGAVRRT